jgi:hypothetical protein
LPVRRFRPLAAPLRAVEIGVDPVAHVLTLPDRPGGTTARPAHFWGGSTRPVRSR